jgi:hypothetical protein
VFAETFLAFAFFLVNCIGQYHVICSSESMVKQVILDDASYNHVGCRFLQISIKI